MFADIKMLAVHKAGQVARLCAVLPKTQVQQIYRYYGTVPVGTVTNYGSSKMLKKHVCGLVRMLLVFYKDTDAAPNKFGWILSKLANLVIFLTGYRSRTYLFVRSHPSLFTIKNRDPHLTVNGYGSACNLF